MAPGDEVTPRRAAVAVLVAAVVTAIVLTIIGEVTRPRPSVESSPERSDRTEVPLLWSGEGMPRQ